MGVFFDTQPLRFKCTGCGKCCTGAHDYYVFLAEAEVETIRAFMGVSRAWFRRRYLQPLDDGQRVLPSTDGGACVFLQRDKTCRIYPVRPVQCRTYPFWPELMNARAWALEARHCEGIGRGQPVPVKTIRANLRLLALGEDHD